MKKPVYVLSVFFSILLISGCQLEKIEPVIPENTFEKIMNGEYYSSLPHMCMQNDGNVRMVFADCINAPTFFNCGSREWVLDIKGNIVWKKAFSNYRPEYPSAIIPRNLGGYYFAENAFQNTLGVLDEDGTFSSSVSAPMYSFTSSVGGDDNKPANMMSYTDQVGIPKIAVVAVVNTADSIVLESYNDDLQITNTGLMISVPLSGLYGSSQNPWALNLRDTGCLLIAPGMPNLYKLVSEFDWFSDISVTWRIAWNKTYDNQPLNCALETGDGGYLIVGSSVLLKTDVNGNKQWMSNLSLNCSFIKATQDGNYLLCGSKDSKACAAKIKVEGGSYTLVWEKTYSQGINLYQAIETPDKGFFMLGVSGGKGFHVVKTDADGNVF